MATDVAIDTTMARRYHTIGHDLEYANGKSRGQLQWSCTMNTPLEHVAALLVVVGTP